MEQFLREYVQEQIELANYQARQQEYITLERHYDAMKDELRKIRAAAKQEFRADLAEKYNERYKTEKSYYSAMSSLARSETLFGMLISASRAVYAMKKGRKISEQINELKSEKRSFYKIHVI